MSKKDILSLALKLSSPHSVKKSDFCLLDGKKVIDTVENINCNFIENVIVNEEKVSQQYITEMENRYKHKLTITDYVFFKKIKQTKNSQGILAIAKKPAVKNIEKLTTDFKRCIYFDNIQDPVNAGAIIRTGLAMGWNNFVFSKGSVSTGKTNFIRSSSGYVYKASVFESDIADINRDLFFETLFLAADMEGEDVNIIKTDSKKNILLIVGNEGSGISEKTYKYLEENPCSLKRCSLPMKNGIDSLSVSQAASILLFAFRLQ